MTILIKRNPPTRRLAIERLEDRSLLSVVVAPNDSTRYEDGRSPQESCGAWVDLEHTLAVNAQEALQQDAQKCQEETGLEGQEEKESPDEIPISESSEGDASSSSDDVVNRASELNVQGLAPDGRADVSEAPASDSPGASDFNGIAPHVSEANRSSHRAGPVDLQRVFLDPVAERRSDSSSAFTSPSVSESASGILTSSRRSGGTQPLGVAMRPSLGMTRLMDGAAAKTSLSTGSTPYTSTGFATQVHGTATTGRIPRRSSDAPPPDRSSASPQRLRTYFVTRQDKSVPGKSVDDAARWSTVSHSWPFPPATEAAWRGQRHVSEPAEKLPPKATPDRPATLQSTPRARIVAEAESSGGRQTM